MNRLKLRGLRHIAACLMLASLAFVPLWGYEHVTMPRMWRADFHNAVCIGPCCLVTDDFLEISCGEGYLPAAP